MERKRVAVLAETNYQELELWYPLLRVREARAEWVDEEVVRDGNLITSRMPSDLPAFCCEIIKALSKSTE